MSEFSRFMKANKKVKENQKYAPTASLTEITSRENEELRNACTVEVPVTGKPNMYRPRLNTEKYVSKMMAGATVYPDLYDEELQDSYGVKTPEDLLYAMVDGAGEFQMFEVWMQKFQGFTDSFDVKVDEAKN